MKNKILLCVATKEEAELLLPSGLEDLPVYTLITGIGFGNTINALKDYAFDDVIVLNIGFVGATKDLDINNLYNINVSLLGPNDNGLSPTRHLKLIKDLDTLPCVSVTDFETNPDRFYPTTCYTKDYVVDMELYPIASYFDNVYAIKVPSDRGDIKDYYNQKNNRARLNILKARIKDIILELCDNE